MRWEIKIAGFGDQGIILMGVMLAEAAGYYGDYEVAQTQSYGPEARGGACKTEVVISDELIDYTKTTDPDVFIAMSQPALDRYINEINHKEAKIFVDQTLVQNIPQGIKHLYRVPATKLAENKCGTKLVSNTVMLCVVLNKTNILPTETIHKVLTKHLDPKLQEVNLNAFKVALGYCSKTGELE